MQICKNFFLPVISGIAVSLSFFSEKYAFLIFFSVIPLMYSILTETKLLKIFIYSLTLYASSFYWISNSVSKLTNNSIVQFFTAIFLISGISIILSLILVLPFCVFRLIHFTKIKTAVIFPFLYIFGEWLQGAFYPIAFPWLRLGVIASPFTVFIQSASLFGSLFISLLILYINMSVALIFSDVKKSRKYAFILTAFLITFTNLIYGYKRLDNNILNTSNTAKQNALIVQGNYPRETKFDAEPDEILEKYLSLSYSCGNQNADLIIFPETSMKSSIYKNTETLEMMYKLCSDFNALLLFGSQYDLENKHYNACITVNQSGDINAAYLKRFLVPYGEYDPLKLKFLNFSASDFSAGEECSIINTANGKIGCAICFESIFPTSVSECVVNGAQVIAILTNDSWLGNKIPLYQHHAHSVMRAVENNRFVLTSTNTGISSIIDNYGNITAKSRFNTDDVLYGSYKLNNKIIFYSLFGDIIILPSCIIILYCCVMTLFRVTLNLFQIISKRLELLKKILYNNNRLSKG